MLIVFGAIISSTALVDPHHKRSAPRVGFPLFLAPTSALVFMIAFGEISDWLIPSLAGWAILAGYLVGLGGGLMLGLRLAARHKRHLINSLPAEDDPDDYDES